MGQRFLSTKTKDKSFDFNRSTKDFSGIKKGKIGSVKNPAIIIVQTKEKRDDLKKIFDENGWNCRISVRPEEDENLRDLETLQRVGVTKVNEVNVERNSPCLCGSGKKYKKCCMNK